ncbi:MULTISPECIES: NUDIX hydrolase [unclassified Brevundimonas]|uniref:NUDIX hydrolase n=1 Tax=unclassified Brevundimonas TaxID=2622653 RepID=UPI003F8F807E
MTGKPRTEASETRQVAALPWRRGEAGVEVMMITSRETRRWVIPKGGRMVGKTDPQAAAQEAYEEAGIQGETLETPVGHFRYAKRMKSGATQACIVAVYPLEVLIQLGAWPEDLQRERRWMNQGDAAAAVDEADLSDLIRAFQPPPLIS